MAIRDEFDGDMWALKAGDRLTHREELNLPEGIRDYDNMEVTHPTADGRWIRVMLTRPEVEDIVSVDEIALVLRRGSAT